MEVKNLKCSYKEDEACQPVEKAIKKAEVAEEKVDIVDIGNGCVNHIIIKPEVDMTFDIESLLTGQAVVETDNKVAEKEVDDHVACDCINCIVIKPKIKIDCKITGLNTGVIG